MQQHLLDVLIYFVAMFCHAFAVQTRRRCLIHSQMTQAKQYPLIFTLIISESTKYKSTRNEEVLTLCDVKVSECGFQKIQKDSEFLVFGA
jgi:hypothetical protein